LKKKKKKSPKNSKKEKKKKICKIKEMKVPSNLGEGAEEIMK